MIATIARTQHGVVAHAQLLAAELTEREIYLRVQDGSLISIHFGVYRAGHDAPSLLATYMAAVLACGEGALLSGRAAGRLLDLVREAATPEVTAPVQRLVPGVLTHRARRVARHGMVSRGIPVTTVPETLVDLAAVLRRPPLARACHEAQVKHDTEPRDIEAVIARRWNSKGVRNLKAILRGDVHVTLSRLESRFIALLKRERLPLPITNRPAGGRYVDCRWPAHRLTVELDSYRYHRSRHSWERDRQREREARLRGDEFRRFTWEDVTADTSYLLRELRALLNRAVLHPLPPG